jgi:nitrogen fixation protein
MVLKSLIDQLRDDNTDVELLKRGWVLIFLDLPDHYGCPRAVASFARMHADIT